MQNNFDIRFVSYYFLNLSICEKSCQFAQVLWQMHSTIPSFSVIAVLQKRVLKHTEL